MSDFQFGAICFAYGTAFGAWVINNVHAFCWRRRNG